MKNLIKYSLLILIFFACRSGQKNLPSQFDAGSIEKNIYTNKYFNMQITFPPDWQVVEMEEMEVFRKNNMEGMLVEKYGENQQPDQRDINSLESTMNNSAAIFNLFKYSTTENANFNPSLLLSVLNIKGDGLDQTAKGYLHDIRALKKRSPIKYELCKEFYWQEIGGETFDAMWQINYENIPAVMQEMFVRKTNDLLLFLVITYSNPEEKSELHEILARIEKVK